MLNYGKGITDTSFPLKRLSFQRTVMVYNSQDCVIFTLSTPWDYQDCFTAKQFKVINSPLPCLPDVPAVTVIHQLLEIHGCK